MMRLSFTILLALCTCSSAESELRKAFEKQNKQPKQTKEQVLQQHKKGSDEIATDQDELAADVQELIQEETNGKVIKLLSEAELLMVKTTDRLSHSDTSGETMAMPTEIIEKIAGAAKERSKDSKSGNQNNPLLQMMEQMMGKSSGQAQQGQKPSSKAGEGMEGESDSLNQASSGKSEGNVEPRTVPKNSGSAGTQLPKEFKQALKAYNKAQSSK